MQPLERHIKSLLDGQLHAGCADRCCHAAGPHGGSSDNSVDVGGGQPSNFERLEGLQISVLSNSFQERKKKGRVRNRWSRTKEKKTYDRKIEGKKKADLPREIQRHPSILLSSLPEAFSCRRFSSFTSPPPSSTYPHSTVIPLAIPSVSAGSDRLSYYYCQEIIHFSIAAQPLARLILYETRRDQTRRVKHGTGTPSDGRPSTRSSSTSRLETELPQCTQAPAVERAASRSSFHHRLFFFFFSPSFQLQI